MQNPQQAHAKREESAVQTTEIRAKIAVIDFMEFGGGDPCGRRAAKSFGGQRPFPD